MYERNSWNLFHHYKSVSVYLVLLRFSIYMQAGDAVVSANTYCCMFAGHDTVVESVEIAVACKAQHSTYRIG